MAGRRWRVLAAGVGLLVADGCPAPDSAGRQPPRLVFDSTEYDAGRVRQGDAVAVAFAFRNAGDRPLMIEPPRAGCDCEATLPARTLLPGAEAAVEVRCATTHSAGPLSRTVTIYANDPARPATTLTLSADVQPVAIAEPPSVYLGHVRRGEDIVMPVKLLVPRAATGTFGGPEVYGRVVRGALAPLPPRETPAEMRGALLRLGIVTDAPLGPFATRVRIPTGEATVPAVSVEVGGIVDGTVVASPPQLDFGRVAAAASATRVLEVRGTTERAVTVTAARLEPAVGHVDTEAVQPGRVYRVTARLEGSASRPLAVGRLHGTLVVDTDAADTARIEVPFTARVVQQ